MALPSKKLREGVPEGITGSVHEGVLVVIVSRRRPSVSVVSDVIDIVADWVADADFEPPLHALVDFRKAMFAPSGQEIREGAMRLGRLGISGEIALVVANDFQFGVGRMFGLLCDLGEGSSIDIRPFRDVTEATRWVRNA